MKRAIRGASSIALLAGLASFSSAYAQQNQTVETTTQAQQGQANQDVQQTNQATGQARPAGERVVVTGSLIATAPEDAPRPVEVYTAEDLEEQGSPSISEFVRNLTVSASSGTGQALANAPGAAGFTSANLRGQGVNGTLVLMNGRRVASTNGGAGADLNTLPVEALEAVEVLKDGASATYGAGAVGGVLNFRTRRDIDAPQITLERSFYDGSEGSYKLDFLTGWVGDGSNLLISLSTSHEDNMLAWKRDFASLPYSVNPEGWSTFANNPGRWQGARQFYTRATPSNFTAVSGAINDYRTADDCRALGAETADTLLPGAEISAGIPNTLCALPRYYFEDLVNENSSDRAYIEYNGTMSETMEFHVDGTYSKSETISRGIPIDPIIGAYGATSNEISTTFCGFSGSCMYAVPYDVRVVNTAGAFTGQTVRNPFIDDFNARTGGIAGTTDDALYNSQTWRPFAMGGNPLFDDGLRQTKTTRERFLINAGINGEFSADGMLGFLDGISYDYAAQYNQYLQSNNVPDLITARLQNALLGYGGPNCQAVDRVATDYTNAATFNRTVGIQSDTLPGTNGCQFFNPFASAYPTSIANGADNPQYGGPDYENSVDLVRWMTHPRNSEDQYQAVTFDALWSGQIPDSFSLPGGQIGWALGTQWRQIERRDIVLGEDEDYEQLAIQDCPFPDPTTPISYVDPGQNSGQLGCTAGGGTPGAFFSSLSGDLQMEYSDSQTIAYFAEVQLPILHNLNATASVRREEFNGGDITGDIWSVAAKYNFTDNLYIRGSYGTNFRAEQILDIDPGFTTVGAQTPARFGSGLGITTLTTNSPNLRPEDDITLNLGVGYEGYVGEGRITARVDFFEIERQDELATTSTATIYEDVFGANTGLTANSPDQVADCTAPLVGFLVFANGCTAGTTAADLVAVQLFRLNGPGFLTNGVDYEFDYSHPFMDGDVGFNVTATQTLTYEATDFIVNGTLFEDGGDRLGFQNVGQSGSLVNEWRANASVRWRNDRHNINLRANLVSGITDERTLGIGSFTSIDDTGTTPLYSDYGTEAEDYVDFDLTYIYSAPFWEELDLRLTILNLTDEDPMPFQDTFGYFTGIGNPRGRQVELGVTKRF